MSILDKLHRQKEILEYQGYTVAYICVYGSQNYGLSISTEGYQSDLDMKAIVVPTLDDLIRNSKPTSKVVDTEWGQCDVKDIRKYFETLLKGNPAYVETLFTDYYVVDDNFVEQFNAIFRLREDLVHALQVQIIKAMYGMMLEKKKALCHPYPSIAHKIEKYGWDGKQLHHIYRLWLMMKSYFDDKLKMSKCFYPPESEINFLLDLKQNKLFNADEAIKFSDEITEKANVFKNKIIEEIDESKINYLVKNDFLILSQSIIKNKIMLEIGGR